MQNTQSFLNPIIATNVRAVNGGGFTVSQDIANSQLAILNTATMVSVPTSFNGGTMYGVVPTNGNGDLTWTRGSDAWRTNREGLVQRTPWNLVQYSEQFDNAYWNKQNASITANSITSPNNTLTGDKLVENTANSNHNVLSTSTTVTNSSNYVTSVYAKAGERNWILVIYFDGANIKGRFFNLTDGTGGQYYLGVPIANTIQNVGNGWYKITLSFVTTSTSCILGYYLASADGTVSYTGNGTSGLYIWGAQLVEGTLPQPYLPTTDRLNVPRIDYSQGTACMLLEPQRTNVSLWSEDFTNAAWTKSTMTFNSSVLSPSGDINAQNYSTNGAFSYIQNQTGYTTTSGAYYSVSVYLKYTSGVGNMFLRLTDPFTTNWVAAQVNLTNGTLVGGITYGGSGASGSASIQNAGNGWYRINVSGTLTQTLLNLQVGNANAGATTFSMYGAQFEAGAFSTTYIKTTTASVTRIADFFIRNNIYTNNLISASGGTWFVQFLNNISYIRDISSFFSLYSLNAGIQNGFTFRISGTLSTRLSIGKYVANTFTDLYLTTANIIKVAIKWNGTTADIFVNGVKQVSATSFTSVDMDNLAQITPVDVPKYIQQMALFNTPLSDLQCATLTSDVTDGFATASLYNRYVNQIGGVIENTNGLINNIQNFK